MKDWEFELFLRFGSRYVGVEEAPRTTTDEFLVPVADLEVVRVLKESREC